MGDYQLSARHPTWRSISTIFTSAQPWFTHFEYDCDNCTPWLGNSVDGHPSLPYTYESIPGALTHNPPSFKYHQHITYKTCGLRILSKQLRVALIKVIPMVYMENGLQRQNWHGHFIEDGALLMAAMKVHIWANLNPRSLLCREIRLLFDFVHGTRMYPLHYEPDEPFITGIRTLQRPTSGWEEYCDANQIGPVDWGNVLADGGAPVWPSPRDWKTKMVLEGH